MWCLLIKEFGPKIQYIKGPKNVIANTLSWLDLLSPTGPTEQVDTAEFYVLIDDNLPSNAFPVTYQLINHKQQLYKTLLATVKKDKNL
jgi:hypothetical protein